MVDFLNERSTPFAQFRFVYLLFCLRKRCSLAVAHFIVPIPLKRQLANVFVVDFEATSIVWKIV